MKKDKKVNYKEVSKKVNSKKEVSSKELASNDLQNITPKVNPWTADTTNDGVLSVDLVFDTGFNATNYPTSWEVLVAKTLSFPAIFVLQDKILPKIRIFAQYKTVKNADYLYFNANTSGTVGIGIEGYIITGITMVNRNTCDLQLQLDPFCTIGLENMEILSGWATRLHSYDDTPFSNILPEPFTQAEASVIEIKEMNVGEETTKLVASNLALHEIGAYEKKIGSISVPFVKVTNVSTIVHFPSLRKEADFKRLLGYTTLYELDDIPTETFETLQSLGLADAIIASYEVPTRFIHRMEKNSNNQITEIVGDGIGYLYTDFFKYKYSDIELKNNKSYCTNNIYHLISLTSGGRQTYSASEVYHESSPEGSGWTLQPDVAPNGKTYARPDYYRGFRGTEGATGLVSLVEGSSWLNVPIAVSGGEGWAFLNQLASLSGAIAGNTTRTLSAEQGIRNAMTDFNVDQSNRMYNTTAEYNRGLIKNLRNTSDLRSYENTLKNVDRNLSPIANAILGQGFNVSGLADTLARFTHSGVNMDSMYNNAFMISEAQSMNALAQQNLIANLQNVSEVANLNYNNDIAQVSLSGAIANAQLQSQKEIIAYTQQASFVPPTISFPNANGLQAYVGNTFVVINERLSDNDLKRYDDYLTRFGYATSEPLTIDKMRSRAKFNFVQAGDVTIKDTSKSIPKYIIRLAEELLKSGVRLWHQPITKEAFEQNTIVTSIAEKIKEAKQNEK